MNILNHEKSYDVLILPCAKQFIQPFNKYFLMAYYVQDTILSTTEKEMKKKKPNQPHQPKLPAFLELTF